MIRFLIALATIAQTCSAAQVLKPIPATIEQLQVSISESEVHAKGEVKGKGAYLKLEYSSLAPIDTYILSLKKTQEIDPRDILYVKLPANREGEALISLSSAPGWTMGDQWYRLHFLTEETELVPSVGIGLTGSPSITSSLKQFFSPEPFIPSSYHRLRGYRFFGLPFTLLLNLILITIFFVTMWRKKMQIGLLLILVGILLAHSRFSLDLLRYTSAHLKEWTSEKTFAAAGSTYEIADDIKESGIKSIKLCSDGNTYFPTLLQYAIYPVRITDDADFVIVLDAYGWSFDDSTLKCGDIEQTAMPLKEFTDGTMIFELTKP